ncbi:hypothetical protein HHI36_002012 [Cryptolaemus montrouzieri]|uniref:Peptidase S1 domain-containing protein n=1 Tax=Cryptolaemus montrouzieri TaxID=559131 RepID=A0ABD2P9N5_9CUCU
MICKTIEIIVLLQFLMFQLGHFQYFELYDHKDPPRSKYPFLVSLRKLDYLEMHNCSGSLVSFSWVLTSAHCVKPFANNPEKLYMIAGKPNSSEEQIIRSETIYYHNQFNEESFFNDIALVSTVRPFERNPSVNIINLPKFTLHIEIRTKCKYMEVLGFETHEFYYTKPRRVVLRSLMFNYNHSVMSEADCARNREFKVMKNTFCGTAKNMTACLADTGGPAICEGLVYGITYYGCPWDESPSYFTRVDRYLIFIERILGWEAPFSEEKRNLESGEQCPRTTILSLVLTCVLILVFNKQ